MSAESPKVSRRQALRITAAAGVVNPQSRNVTFTLTDWP